MTDPALLVQGAIVAAIKADAECQSLFGARIFDFIVADPVPPMPYASFGPSQVIQDDADCINGAQVFQQIDVWSEEPEFVECKRISGVLRRLLHHMAVTRDGATFEIEHRFTTTARDSDGVTSHAVMSFFALIDQPEGV